MNRMTHPCVSHYGCMNLLCALLLDFLNQEAWGAWLLSQSVNERAGQGIRGKVLDVGRWYLAHVNIDVRISEGK
jgi:hypothetical protein